MNSIDSDATEKRKIITWAGDNCDLSLFRTSKDADSYFSPIPDNYEKLSDLMPESFPDIMKALNNMWSNCKVMTDISKVCGVAMMKHIPPKYQTVKENIDIDKSDKETDIPPFIYAF